MNWDEALSQRYEDRGRQPGIRLCCPQVSALMEWTATPGEEGKDTAGDWLVTNQPDYQGGDWDAYLLFGPNAAWTATPHPLISSGSPVIGKSDQLQASILPLLRDAPHPHGG